MPGLLWLSLSNGGILKEGNDEEKEKTRDEEGKKGLGWGEHTIRRQLGSCGTVSSLGKKNMTTETSESQ